MKSWRKKRGENENEKEQEQAYPKEILQCPNQVIGTLQFAHSLSKNAPHSLLTWSPPGSSPSFMFLACLPARLPTSLFVRPHPWLYLP